MKPYGRLLILLVVAAVVGVASHAISHRFGCGKRADSPAQAQACWHNTDWLATELKLTPEQKAKLAPLNAEYAAALESACAAHRLLHAQLNSALFDAGASAGKSDALLAEMSRARLEADRATLRHIRAVSALLTPDQLKAFQKLFECHHDCNKKS